MVPWDFGEVRLCPASVQIREIFEGVLSQLEVNPASPRLRLHPLHGQHRGKHPVRLTGEHRIVIVLRTRKSTGADLPKEKY